METLKILLIFIVIAACITFCKLIEGLDTMTYGEYLVLPDKVTKTFYGGDCYGKEIGDTCSVSDDIVNNPLPGICYSESEDSDVFCLLNNQSIVDSLMGDIQEVSLYDIEGITETSYVLIKVGDKIINSRIFNESPNDHTNYVFTSKYRLNDEKYSGGDTVTINSISYYKKILKTLSSSDINYTTDLILSVDGYLTMYSEDDNFFRVNSIKDNLDGYEGDAVYIPNYGIKDDDSQFQIVDTTDLIDFIGYDTTITTNKGFIEECLYSKNDDGVCECPTNNIQISGVEANPVCNTCLQGEYDGGSCIECSTYNRPYDESIPGCGICGKTNQLYKLYDEDTGSCRQIALTDDKQIITYYGENSIDGGNSITSVNNGNYNELLESFYRNNQSNDIKQVIVGAPQELDDEYTELVFSSNPVPREDVQNAMQDVQNSDQDLDGMYTMVQKLLCESISDETICENYSACDYYPNLNKCSLFVPSSNYFKLHYIPLGSLTGDDYEEEILSISEDLTTTTTVDSCARPDNYDNAYILPDGNNIDSGIYVDDENIRCNTNSDMNINSSLNNYGKRGYPVIDCFEDNSQTTTNIYGCIDKYDYDDLTINFDPINFDTRLSQECRELMEMSGYTKYSTSYTGDYPGCYLFNPCPPGQQYSTESHTCVVTCPVGDTCF